MISCDLVSGVTHRAHTEDLGLVPNQVLHGLIQVIKVPKRGLPLMDKRSSKHLQRRCSLHQIKWQVGDPAGGIHPAIPPSLIEFTNMPVLGAHGRTRMLGNSPVTMRTQVLPDPKSAPLSPGRSVDSTPLPQRVNAVLTLTRHT